MEGDHRTYREIQVELTLATLQRIEKWAWLSERSIADEAVARMRIALTRVYPPTSAEEWWRVVEWEDWAELLRVTLRFVRGMLRRMLGIPEREFASKYQEKFQGKYLPLILQVPLKIVVKLEQIARSRLIPVSEAAEYTIEYAMTEVFPEKTPEENERELREMWGQIWHALWTA